jgi:hypothetical protein
MHLYKPECIHQMQIMKQKTRWEASFGQLTTQTCDPHRAI